MNIDLEQKRAWRQRRKEQTMCSYYRDRMQSAPWGAGIILGTMAMCGVLLLAAVAHGEDIDLKAIAKIESSGNPLAHNKRDDSRGLYQITPIALADYNQMHAAKRYTMEDLWNPIINETIARWMFEQRIPQLLHHFNKPDTIKNRIIAYNCGISCVVKDRIPKVTKNYLKKYRTEAAR